MRVTLDNGLGLDELWRVAHGEARIELSRGVLDAVARNRAAFERALAAGDPVYGVTTGVGALVGEPAPAAPASEVAAGLLRSHAASAGGGELPREVVRAALAARLATLARARSGVRPRLLEAIAALLDADVVPVVPSGTLGPPGALAAPAHAFLALMGEGEVRDATRRRTAAARALPRHGLEPLALDAREATALMSGTSFPAAIAGLAAVRVRRVLDAADVAAALAFAALDAARPALSERVHALAHVPGQALSAAHMRALLAGGDEGAAALPQAPVSLRSAPQVHGAARAAQGFFEPLVEDELDAATDNPLVLENPDEIVSAGAFHGQALAGACDAMRAALADLAAISERRTARLLGPTFLSRQPGASGYMIVQYTAASLATELRVLAHAVAAENAVVSAGQEDHNSHATLAASMLGEAVARAETVVAIELLCAAQALDLRADEHRWAAGVRMAYRLVRTRVAALDRDRPPAPDIAAVAQLVASGELSALLEGLAPHDVKRGRFAKDEARRS